MLVAVGLYFPFWYSAPQVARTRRVGDDVGADRWDRLGDNPTTAALRAWAIAVAGALATVAVLAAVYLTFPNPLAGVDRLPGAVALWSVFISIVALPHILGGLCSTPIAGSGTCPEAGVSVSGHAHHEAARPMVYEFVVQG